MKGLRSALQQRSPYQLVKMTTLALTKSQSSSPKVILKLHLVSDQYDQGLITEDERYSLTVANWRGVDRKVEDFLRGELANMDTSISTMVNSGARGNIRTSSLRAP
jgi:hypothetical protein